MLLIGYINGKGYQCRRYIDFAVLLVVKGA